MKARDFFYRLLTQFVIARFLYPKMKQSHHILKLNMKAIKVKITRFISNNQLGFIECKFYDAFNNEHIIEDKIPVITNKNIDAYSKYPIDETISCEILDERNQDGKVIITASTLKPWGLETTMGISEFELLTDQITEI